LKKKPLHSDGTGKINRKTPNNRKWNGDSRGGEFSSNGGTGGSSGAQEAFKISLVGSESKGVSGSRKKEQEAPTAKEKDLYLGGGISEEKQGKKEREHKRYSSGIDAEKESLTREGKEVKDGKGGCWFAQGGKKKIEEKLPGGKIPTAVTLGERPGVRGDEPECAWSLEKEWC